MFVLPRGVIQTLVDKHFPATDKKKMADLQGFRDSYLNGSRSEVSSPVPKKKRKLNSKSITPLILPIFFAVFSSSHKSFKGNSLCEQI